MSFSDHKSFSKPGAPSPVPISVSKANEVRAHLRALAANSAALRNWEGSSSVEDAASEVKRVRSLRAQNRDLVRKCASLLADLETEAKEPNSDPSVRADVEELKELYRQRIEDFSRALPESLARERDAIAAAQVAASPATVASLPELGNSRQSNTNGVYNEQSGLLSANASDAALLRESQGLQRLRQERVTRLREIEQSVEDVNVTMTELASLIGEQESTLEFVTVNIEESAQNVTAARRELERARRGRENKRKLFYSLLAVVALIIAMLIVILLS